MNQVKEFLEYILNIIKIWVIIQPWESGLIVRNGKTIKKRNGGIYFKLPYFDSVYIQETRLRIVSLATQTITSADGKTVTLSGAIGYSINDIQKLYETLFHPETTIQNIAMANVSEFINSRKYNEISTKKIEDNALTELKLLNYGIDFSYFKLTNFAKVKTYRLIQDRNWISEGLKMDEKK